MRALSITLHTVAATCCALILMGGHCGGAPDDSDTPVIDVPVTCSLTCSFGFKRDLAGRQFCECRTAEICPSEGIAPFVDPESNACLGFPTDCDIPAGWEPCGPCAADACGTPPPDLTALTCGDGSVAGLFGCGRTELGTCEWSYMECPEVECGTFAHLTCVAGFTCVDLVDDCNPQGGNCPGVCRTPNGGTSIAVP